MKIKEKENSKKRNRPWIVTSIAIIDILLGLVMIYMMITSITVLSNFYKNPELASGIFETFGTSYSSMILFMIKVFALMIATFIFAIGMLKTKKWAILGRISLAAVLMIYYLSNYIIGNVNEWTLLLYYDILVILSLGWIQFKKR